MKALRERFKYHWRLRVGIAGILFQMYYIILRMLRVDANKRLFPIRVRGFKHPLFGRFETSDGAVFHQIFIQKEYACLTNIEEPKLIIDCGANVGYSSAWFLHYYPTAEVLSVEADSGNYRLCKKNLEPYGKRATPICAGVWPYDSSLVVVRGDYKDGQEWSFRVREAKRDEKPDFSGTQIGTLLEKSGHTAIDILKIDIETGEKMLFSSNYDSWLTKVKNIVIELHDQECQEIFFKAMSGYDYELSHSGELTVLKNIGPKVSFEVKESNVNADIDRAEIPS